MYILWCSVLYMYNVQYIHISLTMHMHMNACIHNMENVSFNFQTLIFFNCHIWASTKLLCTRVWRTLVGKKNKWLFVYDFPWFSSRKLSEWNVKLLTFYGLCNRAKGKCAIRSSTHSNVQCGWNTLKCILYIDSRATNHQCSIFSRHACSVAELLQSDTVLTPSLQ